MPQGARVCPLDSEFEKRVVWNFADEVTGRPPETWRRDVCGSLIRWSEYGLSTPFGWKIVVSQPERAGVSISNKQALHWKNIRPQGRDRPGRQKKAEG